jgi:Trypsin-like peptidase domain
MRRAVLLAAFCALAAGCEVNNISPPAFPKVPGVADDDEAKSAQAEVVARSLPALVLLLNTHADGSVGYGSGLIVDHAGTVLTSLHVVENGKLGAMLYRKDRVSYTPMDGGLGRYMFENQKEVLTATLVARDATADLALVKLAVPTPDAPILQFSHKAVSPGDRVFALGHPQETVWSFTSGVVSALHNGAIQHDATISQGSSGGPLLNEAGEVIGINTHKVASEARGLSFARPADMAQRLVATGEGEVEIDRSTPEKAIQGCWHANELASSAVTGCVDWDAAYRAFIAAIDDLRRRGFSPAAGRAMASMQGGGGRDAWIDAKKQALAKSIRDGATPQSWDAPSNATPEVTRTLAELHASSEKQRAARLEKNGLKLDLGDPKAMHDRLRMGMRVDEVRSVAPGVAWALLSGRNPDGTVYRLSDCWIQVDEVWVERPAPAAEDLNRLPKGWPPPVDDFTHAVEREAASVLVGGSAAIASGGSATATRSVR